MARHSLTRLAIDRVESAAEDVMACHDVIERSLQGGDVEGAGQPDRCSAMADRLVRLRVVQ
jgi:hypothetical protein